MLGELKSTINRVSHGVYEVATRSISLVLNADRDLYQAYSAYQYLESGQLKDADKELWRTTVNENINEASERLAEAAAIAESSQLSQLSNGPTKRPLSEIGEQFSANFSKWNEEVMKSINDNTNSMNNAQIIELFNVTRTDLNEIGEMMDLYAKEQIDDSYESYHTTKITNYIAMAFIIIALLLLIYFSIRTTMRSVNTIMSKTKMVAEGDLTELAEMKYNKDELGDISRSVDQMITGIKTLIKGITANAKDVDKSTKQLSTASQESASAAEHVAHNIQEVTNGTEIQARGAQETAKAIEEMAIGIGRITENTSMMADHSSATSHEADQGKAALERLVEQMNQVKNVIGKLSGVIGHLETRSQEIGAIAENITAFANQTNILSLNASIEAARAGEHGRGFAVVAGEIRKLASSSLESADGIHQLVVETRNEISGASSYMAQTMQEVEVGNNRVSEVQQNLEVIVASIIKMTEQLQENSAISEQMSASSEQVSASMEQSASSAAANLERTESVAAATEEQLALMDNIAAATNHLDEIVDQLNQAVSSFKV